MRQFKKLYFGAFVLFYISSVVATDNTKFSQAWSLYYRLKLPYRKYLSPYGRPATDSLPDLHQKLFSIFNARAHGNKENTNEPFIHSFEELMEKATTTLSSNIPIHKCTLSEKISILLLLYHIDGVTKRIVEVAQEIDKPKIKIIVFGGIVQGGGTVYESLLKMRLNRIINTYKKKQFLHKKIELAKSTLGDERALIGATLYALASFSSTATNNQSKLGHALALDIGGTNIRAGIINLETLNVEGSIQRTFSLKSPEEKNLMKSLKKKLYKNAGRKIQKIFDNKDPVKFFLSNINDYEQYNQLTEEFTKRLISFLSQFDMAKVEFITIALAGRIGFNGEIKYTSNLPLTKVDFSGALMRIFNKPIHVGNDVFCAGLGELAKGSAQDSQSILSVGVGTGLGLCYVQNHPWNITFKSSEKEDYLY